MVKPSSLFWVSSVSFLAAVALSPLHAQTFTVVSTRGSTFIGSAQGTYEAAGVGKNYPVNSWARTGDESILKIGFCSGNEFRLLGNSEAEVEGENMSNSSWHRVVHLKIGSLEASHTSGGDPTVKLDCETPTSVCGALGTEFTVNATTGHYDVTGGRIVVSSDREPNLTVTEGAGGGVTYAPGSENTYSTGTVNGSITLDGIRFTGEGTYKIAKGLGTDGETALEIEGRLSANGKTYPSGDYLIDDTHAVIPVKPSSTAAGIFPTYMKAAGVEGTLNTRYQSYLKASHGPAVGSLSGQVRSAAGTASSLRAKLFARDTIRQINRDTVQEEIRNATGNH